MAGIGHTQLNFEKVHWQFRYSHGGVLRQKRRGRRQRPLSSRHPVHLVFKIRRENLRGSLRSHRAFKIVTGTLKRYSRKFFIRIEQVNINHDHMHLLIRLPKRSGAQNFLRVTSGQIAQEFQKQDLMKVTDTPKKAKKFKTPGKLWMYRPFTRVVKGYQAYKIVRDYIQLNEKEASGEILYQKQRLRALEVRAKLWDG